ncbi:hypothetical protein BD310DRAFT_276974 [Dichomitus squalens]|uniref:Uncharacterized protein n=1 Tax=Dichomitus squalens TaxID=114155 RepID=A0A4Q9PFU4_9APHY|nr:hypothetical protein BD310DRAFT_276974 [Dichomitus squalens]
MILTDWRHKRHFRLRITPPSRRFRRRTRGCEFGLHMIRALSASDRRRSNLRSDKPITLLLLCWWPWEGSNRYGRALKWTSPDASPGRFAAHAMEGYQRHIQITSNDALNFAFHYSKTHSANARCLHSAIRV